MIFRQSTVCSVQEKGEISTITHHLYGLLELVQVDIWGPIKTASLGGHQYFVSIVNDYSRHYLVYPMR